MERSRLWIATLVVLCGLSWSSHGQKTFRRACDCEYMVDGKCAYTLLLPSGQQGEAMCPENSNMGSMNEDMQSTLNALHRNYTQLLSMYSSQATTLNQVYSTLMDRLLSCPQLQECAMRDMNTPTVTVPSMNMPDGTMPGHEMEMPSMNMPDSTMPGDEMEMPDVGMPDVDMPASRCAEVCPDLDTQLGTIRIMSSELDRTVVNSVADIQRIRNEIRGINDSISTIMLRVMMGVDGDENAEGSDASSIINENVASLALWVNNIVNRGALCLRKGPLVSGDDVNIPDESITASSIYNDQHIASRVRIKSEDEGDLKGAWCPGNFPQTVAIATK